MRYNTTAAHVSVGEGGFIWVRKVELYHVLQISVEISVDEMYNFFQSQFPSNKKSFGHCGWSSYTGSHFLPHWGEKPTNTSFEKSTPSRDYIIQFWNYTI